MQGKVAERRERAWARGDETACQRRQLEILFGFRFEGGERPGAWGAGRWELETERERTRGQRQHERQESEVKMRRQRTHRDRRKMEKSKCKSQDPRNPPQCTIQKSHAFTLTITLAHSRTCSCTLLLGTQRPGV